MQYRDFVGEKVSAFGFGCMRFPTIGEGEEQRIDEAEAIRMIRAAIDRGVNYVDTAYPYHRGESEIVTGKALRDGYREKVFLATKSPVFSLQSGDDFDRVLAEQLEKLQTDYIDFYLLHSLGREKWNSAVLPWKLMDRIRAAKADGRVRHIGFSFHDDYDMFKTIVDAFEGCEFVQLQYNYIDTENQAGTKGVEYAASKGLGVIVMEPLLGGKLANPPAQVAKALPQGRTPVEWAFDFVWNRPEVGTVLSGVSTMQQTLEDIEYADRSAVGMLTPADLAALEEARRVYQSMAYVPCTKCAYCMPCPFGLDIPALYEAYNRSVAVEPAEALKLYDAVEVRADACRQCQQCEGVCPQHISPAEYMPQVAAYFDKVREKLAAAK